MLYSFVYGNGHGDGNEPNGDLIFDDAGNLYGTTSRGGAYNGGTVFELSPTQSGQWNRTLLYSFGADPSEGLRPLAGVVRDAAGNLYGTLQEGGSYATTCPISDKTNLGCGTVFELSPVGGGQWTEQTLYMFQGGQDGEDPESGLVLDASGNLYGSTLAGGTSGCKLDADTGCGTVFELAQTGGAWTETIIYTFDKDGFEGAYPSGVTFDADGNLYGTTEYGGSGGWAGYCGNRLPFACGVVFELSPSQGSWNETIIHYFRGNQVNHLTDGYRCMAKPTFDASGRLVGTTSYGGSNQGLDGWGVAFRLTPGPNGKWGEEHFNFISKNSGAYFPEYPLISDDAGNVYGVSYGGNPNGAWGVVYEITPED